MPVLEIASEGSEPPLPPGRFTAAWKPGVAGVARTCAPGRTKRAQTDRANRVSKRGFIRGPPASDDDLATTDRGGAKRTPRSQTSNDSEEGRLFFMSASLA